MQFAAETGNLLEVLAENGRLGRLDGIINAYSLIMAAKRGEVVCEVTTAKALDGSQRKQLEAALKVNYQYTFIIVKSGPKMYDHRQISKAKLRELL